MISSILHKIRSNNRMGNKYGNKKGDGPSYALSLYTKWRTTARFFLHDISYAAPWKWQTFGQERSDVQIWHDVVQHRWEYVLAVFKIIMVADFHDPGESLHSTDESFFV